MRALTVTARRWMASSEGPSFPTLRRHGAGVRRLARIELDGALGHARLPGGAVRPCPHDGCALRVESRCATAISATSMCSMLAGGAAGEVAEAAATSTVSMSAPACGLPGPPLPSLMTGVAGIGYGLLRLAAPESVPWVLAMCPHARA